MNGKSYGSIVFQLLGAVIAIIFWTLCRDQPDMGGRLIYGYVGLPTTGLALLLSTILAVLSATSDRSKTHRNWIIVINILIAMSAIYSAGQL